MPFRERFDCLWCGASHVTRTPADLEGWASLCPTCIGRAGDNGFLRARLRTALAERSQSADSAAGSTAADADADEFYRREGRFSQGSIQDAAWSMELDAVTAWLDGLQLGPIVVELGAGTGWWSALLANTAELWAYDPSDAFLERLRSRLVAHGLRAHLHRRDIDAPADQEVDAVFAAFALGATPDDRALDQRLDAISGWLRSGGTFAFVEADERSGRGLLDGPRGPIRTFDEAGLRAQARPSRPAADRGRPGRPSAHRRGRRGGRPSIERDDRRIAVGRRLRGSRGTLVAAGSGPGDDIRARLGPIGVWGHLATLSSEELRPFVAHVAGLGYGSLWVGEATMRDPFAQLAAVSEVSAPMTLGTSIVNIFGRDAMAARMGAMTLHELTGGRFVLGLGVSHVHLVEKLRGHRYERPLTHMRAYLEAYRALPYRGPTIAGPDGSPSEPPVLIAALRSRMLELAATATDGALPFLVTAERVAWMRELLDGAAPPASGRPVLAVTLAAVLDEDPVTAREAARAWIGAVLPLGQLPGEPRGAGLRAGRLGAAIRGPAARRDRGLGWSELAAAADRGDARCRRRPRRDHPRRTRRVDRAPAGPRGPGPGSLIRMIGQLGSGRTSTEN